jgi:hypothetical protein
MKLPTRNIVQIFFRAFAFLLTASGAWAHDPFDCSSRLIVQDDRIEIEVTMGLDGARQILAAGGLLPRDVAEAVRPRGPHAILELSATLAAHFFEINCGADKLIARNVTELSEGREVIFTLTYPRPAAGTLKLRANYYDAVTDLRTGSFVAYDEKANQLGAALLSRAGVNANVLLPTPEATPAEAVAPKQFSESTIRAPESPPLHLAAGPRKWSSGRLWLGALPVVAAFAWFANRKPASRKGADAS